MAQFPKHEAQIVALAESLKAGLMSNPAVFPAPPVMGIGIGIKRNQFLTARNSALSYAATAEAATTAKDAALEALTEAMKTDLRYAENTVNFDDDQLKLIGWAGKKAPTPLAAPGQSRLLEAPKQGAGWVFLDWKAPDNGGKPSCYTVQRRYRPDGPWETVATAILTEITLVDQPTAAELEYRVLAVNKAGTGPESNTVMAVL
ncbi:MAG: fibronectin type III domain-containing protein [Phycisphaerae bacterium]|nr:fibronectin type III domain-containing protein [Phycisphaerae bacterium]